MYKANKNAQGKHKATWHCINSIQSPVAQGLLHSKLSVCWNEGCGESPCSNLVFYLASTLKGCSFMTWWLWDPTERGCRTNYFFSMLTSKIFFSSPPLPATSFPRLVLPSEIAVFHVAYPQKQVDGFQTVLYHREENTAIVCKHPI